MSKTTINPDDGPGADLMPVLKHIHNLLAHAVNDAGHPQAVYALALLVPVPGGGGADVVRVMSSLDTDDVASFLRHVLQLVEPAGRDSARRLELAQAIAFIQSLGEDKH